MEPGPAVLRLLQRATAPEALLGIAMTRRDLMPTTRAGSLDDGPANGPAEESWFRPALFTISFTPGFFLLSLPFHLPSPSSSLFETPYLLVQRYI